MKRVKVKSEDELAEAMEQLENEEVDEVEIRGDLKDKVIEIKAVGTIAWGVVIACFTVALVALLAAPSTGGASTIISGSAMAPAVAAVGVGGCTVLAKLVIGTGGLDILDCLYSNAYIAEETKKRIVLKRNDD